MARPPTALTQLFYRARTTEKSYHMLRNRGALSWQGLLHQRKVIELLNGVVEQEAMAARRGPPLAGPSTPDQMGSALADSPYLSARGHRMNTQQPVASDDSRPFWKFWPRS